jgi:hypothetical protein
MTDHKTQSLTILIVEKMGIIKSLTVKEYKEEELYKKCGFKKQDDFTKQTVFHVKHDGNKYAVALYGKTDGKANTENKYDFPPPVDTKLFFGNCALVASKITEHKMEYVPLTTELWEKWYEKLFGGFEDLTVIHESEEEEDELDKIDSCKKTKKGGYLKDGFVVDEEDIEEEYGSDMDIDSNDEYSETDDRHATEQPEQDDALVLEEIGSELSEESYDYSDNEDAK